LVQSTSSGATTELLTQLDTPKYITVSPHLRLEYSQTCPRDHLC